MADHNRLRPAPRHMRSDLSLRLSSDGDLPPRPPPRESRPRNRTSIPRIASLDILASARLGGSRCPSIKSEGSTTSSHRLSPSPNNQSDTGFFQERDHTDREASIDQMINTLHHVMMTKPVLDPVPIEHNSCIKHLLEAYWSLQEQLHKTGQDLVEERETKERSLEEFAKMSSEWEKKEADFLAEIKRMEVVLAKVAPEGVGAVVLARSGSIVDRSKRSSKLFKDRIEKAKSPEKAQDFSNSREIEDSTISAAPDSPRHNHTTYLSMRPNLDGDADAELSEQIRTKQRRRFWGTKYDPRKSPAHTHTTTSSAANESRMGQTSARSTTKSSASGHPRQTADTQESTVPPMTPDSASEVTAIHPDADDSSDLIIGTHGVDLAAEPARHQLHDEHPDILKETHEQDSRQDEHKCHGVNRHKREFSFDPGEDGIPLIRLESKPLAGENSTNHDRFKCGSVQGDRKHQF